jgi:hypothetical protein
MKMKNQVSKIFLKKTAAEKREKHQHRSKKKLVSEK